MPLSAHQNTAALQRPTPSPPERPVGHEEQPHRHHADRSAASIAPSKGRSTRRPGETARRRPWQQRRAGPAPGHAGAKCPFHMCNNNDKHTTMNRTKPQRIMPAQLRSDFTVILLMLPLTHVHVAQSDKAFRQSMPITPLPALKTGIVTSRHPGRIKLAVYFCWL